MLRHFRLLALVFLLAVLAATGSRLSGQTPAAVPTAQEFDALHFRSIGPASMSGRIADLAVYEANPAVYYVGTAHGGVWKTTSNGATFEAQFQNQGLISIGDVTVSQSNPDLVWVGTGESNNRQSTSWGDGVYKSTNGGREWTHMGLRESRHINRILIHPRNNDIVFVAATGALFGAGGERGIYKTTDGGKSWKQVLKVDDDTGANDLIMSSTDPNIMFASTYQRRRSQCCMNGGGPGSGVWKSTDGGDTWTRLQGGLPTAQMGRIALDVYRRSPNIVYALIEGEPSGGGGRGGFGGGGGGRGGGGRGGGDPQQAGRGGAVADPEQPAGGRGAGGGGGNPCDGAGDTGLYRSDDGGANWRKVCAVNPRPMYFSQLRIDPSNPETIYMGGVGLHMSVDGGRSMETDAAFVTHDDVHAIWIDPNNSDHLVIGHDGGVSVSYDKSRTWIQLPNLPLALYYHVSYDMATPYNVCGGLQDNYNWCGPSATRFSRGIINSDWYQVQGGDGFVVLVDQTDQRIVYSESQNGNIQRKNRLTGESKNIRPNNSNVQSLPENTPGFRWNWDTPMVFSAHDPSTLIVAANRVFTSRDKGDSWTMISPDLTTNADRNEIQTMGKPGNDPLLIARHDGITSWPTLVALAESPKQPGVYFTGSDDGVVSMTRDGGKKWENITSRLSGFPKGGWVSEVVPSAHNANTVYVTVDAHRLNDYKTYIWASDDMGATFRSLNGNLSGEVVKTLLEDPKTADVLYIGTETGLFLTLDRGKSWRRLGANLPTVRVDEIAIHSRDNAMIVGTHGRALWILDSVSPIQEYSAAQGASRDASLFSISPALQWRQMDHQNDEFWGHQVFVGENPPADAVIQYHLKKTVGDLKLRITDSTGREVRLLDVPANRNQAGMQTMCWDMRVQPVLTPGGGGAGGGRGGGGGGGGGGRGGGGRGPVPGIPTQPPPAGHNPRNPCAGLPGGGSAGPLVMPGTYNVSLMVDGKAVDTKPMRVVSDPAVQMTDLQRRRYFDTAMELHDLQRRGTEVAVGLNSIHEQMAELSTKLQGASNVPDAVKGQFATFQKEFDSVRAKFGVPFAQDGGAGGRGGGRGGGGFGGGGGGGNPSDVLGRAASIKSQILTFHDLPSDSLLRQHTEVRAELPKVIAEGNAVLTRAAALSAALAKHNITLKVPPPAK